MTVNSKHTNIQTLTSILHPGQFAMANADARWSSICWKMGGGWLSSLWEIFNLSDVFNQNWVNYTADTQSGQGGFPISHQGAVKGTLCWKWYKQDSVQVADRLDFCLRVVISQMTHIQLKIGHISPRNSDIDQMCPTFFFKFLIFLGRLPLLRHQLFFFLF